MLQRRQLIVECSETVITNYVKLKDAAWKEKSSLLWFFFYSRHET